jgi:N-acetylglucosaminyldiphosphoundecaprenol N-acetyl-beta-D-mannosaminyltransferase
MPLPEIPNCPVIGIPLAVIDYDGAVTEAKAWAAAGDRPRGIAAANTHVVTLARQESSFREALARFDLVLPDGMPLVWAMNRKLATPLGDRVYGPTFMLRCLEATQGQGFAHFFVGGTDDLLAALMGRLRAQFPGLQIAGTYAPPFSPWPEGEDERIIGRIVEARANIVWIGLGCPKQERWIAANLDRLPPGIYCAVGAAFAFHAGRVRQAPAWMQRAGLEWLFRLCAEPRRLWRRYFYFNSLFLVYLVRDLWRR